MTIKPPTARDQRAVDGIYGAVDRVVGLGGDPSETVGPEHIADIIGRLFSLDLDLAIPFAPERLPRTLSEATGDALECAAACSVALQRTDLSAASRAVVTALQQEHHNVAAGLVGKASGLVFARLGKADARMRGWAAFFARCAELQERGAL